jgi:hypothetical protein
LINQSSTASSRIVGGRQYNAMRHNSGSWSTLTIPPNNIFVADHASASASDFLHLVSIDTSSVLRHRTRDSVSTWGPVINVFDQTGF